MALTLFMVSSAPLATARAYNPIDGRPHFDHTQKNAIKIMFGGEPDDWLPDDPDNHSWYYFRSDDAARSWTTSSVIGFVRDDYGAVYTNMHVDIQTYHDPDDDRAAFADGGWYRTDTGHWIDAPAVEIGINRAHTNGWDMPDDKAQGVFVHELGHALGLDHVDEGCGDPAWNRGIMQPNISYAYDVCGWFTPKSDDILGVETIYHENSK